MPAELTIAFAETARPLVIHFDAVTTTYSGANVVDSLLVQDEIGNWYEIFAPDSDSNPRISIQTTASASGTPFYMLNPDDDLYYQLVAHRDGAEFSIRLQAAGTGGVNNFTSLVFNAESGSQYRVNVLGTGDNLRYQVSKV